MATDDQIFDVRLRISDPPGFIRFITVADKASLPSEPKPQTAYKVTADGNYYSTEKTTGATADDYSIEDLRVSDDRISNWIDLGGEDYATCQSLKAILSQIGTELGIKKNETGAESVEYTTLKDTYEYYKDLLSQCNSEKQSNEGNSSGLYSRSKQPEIAGGNL